MAVSTTSHTTSHDRSWVLIANQTLKAGQRVGKQTASFCNPLSGLEQHP